MEQIFVSQEHVSLIALVAIMHVENAREKIAVKTQIAINVLVEKLVSLNIKRNLKNE